MKRFLRVGLFAAIPAALYLARPYLFPEKPLAVDIYRAERGEVRETVTSPTSGTVVSPREATVASEASGRVAEILLKQGDRAAEGAPVIVLDERDAQVEVRAAEAAIATRRTALDAAEVQLAKAEEDLKSAEPLFRQRLMAEDQYRAWKATRDAASVEVEAARRALGEAEVALERARVALAKRRICAPFAGMIRRKHVEVGEFVTVGSPAFEMYDDSRLFVRAPLDEVDLPRIRPGLAVDVTLQPFGERVFRGTIREMEPGVRTAKELNRTGDVDVDLLDAPAPAQDGSYPPGEGPLRIGMSADIEVITRTHAGVLRVPSYAVHETDVEKYVFAVAGGKIERRTVQTGYSNWDFAEITSGLAEGDAVVVSLDLKDLAPGKPATVAREVKKPEVQ
ncbi:MAG TPA: efflux RND transporter periplasmic adaptor subunit [Planctomycetota bacterium]|nr:efflux RND transporter periplasmic adaptor subunit [Planctomycetota bacterium]